MGTIVMHYFVLLVSSLICAAFSVFMQRWCFNLYYILFRVYITSIVSKLQNIHYAIYFAIYMLLNTFYIISDTKWALPKGYYPYYSIIKMSWNDYSVDIRDEVMQPRQEIPLVRQIIKSVIINKKQRPFTLVNHVSAVLSAEHVGIQEIR